METIKALFGLFSPFTPYTVSVPLSWVAVAAAVAAYKLGFVG